MSDKLVLEFYDESQLDEPVVALMAFHGGDNPESAALTLADFFQQVQRSSDPHWEGAGSLAALFIIWQQSMASGLENLSRPDVVPIRVAKDYGYQLVKIYAKTSGPVVDVIRDQYTQEDEMLKATAILSLFAIERHVSMAEK